MCLNGKQFKWYFKWNTEHATALAWDKTYLQHNLQVAIMSQAMSKLSGQIEHTLLDKQ